MPVKALSGGEQNRAVLAKLFSKPANLLVLDEPTNDLDIETLELLEEILLTFEGTVLLVSHDRNFMDNVVTSLLVLDGHGGIEEHVGGYSDWEARGGRLSEAQPFAAPETGAPAKPAAAKDQRPAQPKRKLSYKEQRELDSLPARLEALEQQQSELEGLLAGPGFYQSPQEEIQRVTQQLADVHSQLETCYQRWSELEAGSG
jgi:ATP-binding cassette subfamily F protein uup